MAIADSNGNLVETAGRGFDPFGKPREDDWSDSDHRNNGLNDLGDTADIPGDLNRDDLTTRGFTGHEHLNETDLIHMNGRVYDYNLGRFYSVDPFIQFPENSQSVNGYSYILNNPLSGTDPTGYQVQPSVKNCDTLVVCSRNEWHEHLRNVGPSRNGFDVEKTVDSAGDGTIAAESKMSQDQRTSQDNALNALQEMSGDSGGKEFPDEFKEGDFFSFLMGIATTFANREADRLFYEQPGVGNPLIQNFHFGMSLAETCECEFVAPFDLPDSNLGLLGADSEPAVELVSFLTTRSIQGVSASLKRAARSSGNVTLYRVVDDVELADIQKTGAFRAVLGSFEGKQFVGSLGDAKALQKVFADFFG